MSLKKQKTTSHLQRSRKKSQLHYGKKQVLSLSFPVFPNPWTEPTPLKLTTSPKQIPPKKMTSSPSFIVVKHKKFAKMHPKKTKQTNDNNHLPEHSCKNGNESSEGPGESSLRFHTNPFTYGLRIPVPGSESPQRKTLTKHQVTIGPLIQFIDTPLKSPRIKPSEP